jgi:hypothetical protein
MSQAAGRREGLIVSWGVGGNLPPLLAAGRLLADRNHHVSVLASAATRQAAVDAGFDVAGYRRTPDPEGAVRDVGVADRGDPSGKRQSAPFTCVICSSRTLSPPLVTRV